MGPWCEWSKPLPLHGRIIAGLNPVGSTRSPRCKLSWMFKGFSHSTWVSPKISWFWLPEFLSRQRELLCKQSRKLRGCKSYLRLNFVGYKNSSTWYIISCSVLDLWYGCWFICTCGSRGNYACGLHVKKWKTRRCMKVEARRCKLQDILGEVSCYCIRPRF